MIYAICIASASTTAVTAGFHNSSHCRLPQQQSLQVTSVRLECCNDVLGGLCVLLRRAARG